jgi:hypothetical protein
MLHLNYLKIKSDSITLQTILECGNLLNETPFVNFLKQHNYTFYNYSCFDVNNQSKAIRVYFFPTFEELYLSQTLISRVKRDIGFNFLSPKVIESHVKLNLTKDSTIDDLTRKAVNQTGSPKFIYTHFFMPHHPYFINKDSNNKTYSNLELALNQNKDAYISYLKFANNKILDLIEYIQTNSKNPPVIILLSDHGWRKNETKETNHHQFINLSAISLPDSNYSFFDDKLSNVNQLRMLLNTYFKQSLSKLKDSTYFLIEDEIGTK